MRFYLDTDLSRRVAAIARERGLDVVSAQELGRYEVVDPQHLRLAAEDGRCLVTRNDRHFREATRQALERLTTHAGVLVVTKSLRTEDFAGMAAALIAYDRDHPDGIPNYSYDYLRPAR